MEVHSSTVRGIEVGHQVPFIYTNSKDPFEWAFLFTGDLSLSLSLTLSLSLRIDQYRKLSRHPS